jgi:hypothetical protein
MGVHAQGWLGILTPSDQRANSSNLIQVFVFVFRDQQPVVNSYGLRKGISWLNRLLTSNCSLNSLTAPGSILLLKH